MRDLQRCGSGFCFKRDGGAQISRYCRLPAIEDFFLAFFNQLVLNIKLSEELVPYVPQSQEDSYMTVWVALAFSVSLKKSALQEPRDCMSPKRLRSVFARQGSSLPYLSYKRIRNSCMMAIEQSLELLFPNHLTLHWFSDRKACE